MIIPPSIKQKNKCSNDYIKTNNNKLLLQNFTGLSVLFFSDSVHKLSVPVLRNPKADTLKLAVTTTMFPTAAREEPSKKPGPPEEAGLWKNTKTGASLCQSITSQ